MPDNREFLGDVWCDACKCPIGEVYRVQDGDRWMTLTHPAVFPKYCPFCDAPITKQVIC